MTKKAKKTDSKVANLADRKRKGPRKPAVAGKKPLYETATGFTNADVLQLAEWFDVALGEVKGRPHHLIGYTMGKLGPVIKSYYGTLAKHEQYEDYQKAFEQAQKGISGQILPEEARKLAAKFEDYLTYMKELRDDITEVEVRKFPAAWVDQIEGCPQLTAAINKFDLWDDPEAMADRLFEPEGD